MVRVPLLMVSVGVLSPYHRRLPGWFACLRVCWSDQRRFVFFDFYGFSVDGSRMTFLRCRFRCVLGRPVAPFYVPPAVTRF